MNDAADERKPIKIMFVCMGNICRSPTAHGIFQKMVDDACLTDLIQVQSSGTIGYHIGEPPDARASQMARSRGINLSNLTAQQISQHDYQNQTLILAMDRDNLRNMLNESDIKYHNKIKLFLDYHPDVNLSEVPDPYYDGDQGFQKVFDMVEIACLNLLKELS